MHRTVQHQFRLQQPLIVYRGLQGTLPFDEHTPDTTDHLGREALLRARGSLLKRLVHHRITLPEYKGAIALLQELTR